MWYNRPVYTSYIPYGYGYSSYQDPYAMAAAQDCAAREREAAARRAELLRFQQTQDAARSPYNSYLSDDDGSYVPYPYGARPYSYTPHVNEDLKRRQILEQQRQLELARQAELERPREAERSYKPQSTPTSIPRPSVPISSPTVSPSEPRPTKPPQSPEYPPPSSSPNPVTLEATPEQIRAAMTIQEFYRHRVARREALTSIAEISAQFEKLKSEFSPPPWLDYRSAALDETIPIPVSPESFEHASSIMSSNDDEDAIETSNSKPSLAFTSNNRAVHEYVENLNRLLVELDRVESGGHASVREQRKQMIRNVEAEAQRMDRWIEAVWTLAHQRAQPQRQPQLGRQLRPQPTMEDVFTVN